MECGGPLVECSRPHQHGICPSGVGSTTIFRSCDDRPWSIDDDDLAINRWLSKRSLEEREELLDICASQAEVENNFDIIISYIKEAADKYGKRENDLAGTDIVFGRPINSSYYFHVPDLGFRGNADSILAHSCPNLQHPLPDGWVAQADPDSGTTYYCHRATRTTRWDRPQPNDRPIPEAPEHDNLEPPVSVKNETEQQNELQPRPKKMRLKQTISQRQARLNPPPHNIFRSRTRLQQRRRHNQALPRARPQPPNRKHGLGLALLFLITTVSPSVDGSTFSSNPKTGPHEYAQSERNELAIQEIQVTNVTSTWQIRMISGVIVLTILYLLRRKLSTTTKDRAEHGGSGLAYSLRRKRDCYLPMPFTQL
jgi:hypothetical protein